MTRVDHGIWRPVLLPAVLVAAVVAGVFVTGFHGAGRAASPRPASSRPNPAPSGRTLSVRMRPGESLVRALERAGVAPDDATSARTALADEFDGVNPHPGLTLDLRLAPGGAAQAQALESVALTPRAGETLILSRVGAGGWRLDRLAATAPPPTPTATPPAMATLALATVHGSLYLSLIEAGVPADQASAAVSGFGRRLDLGRDVESGERLRLMFAPVPDMSGRGQPTEALVYAEVASRAGPTRVYRLENARGRPARWVDGDDGQAEAALLRTPLDGARVTSAFGLRFHPLLGYTRLHQGVDFGAPAGTPVFAAADGVVEDARWAGGYGRWLLIRHGQAVETAYGHLSAWASGVGPGSRVRQGQVVAFVGESGLATGPHLHFEVLEAGRRIDPREAPRLAGPAEAGLSAAFRARRQLVDGQIEALAASCRGPAPAPGSPAIRCAG